jgi:hypothetical protein
MHIRRQGTTYLDGQLRKSLNYAQEQDGLSADVLETFPQSPLRTSQDYVYKIVLLVYDSPTEYRLSQRVSTRARHSTRI